MLDDSMTERKIEDQHEKTYKEPDWAELDRDNVRLNVDQQSYGELSVTDDRDNMIKHFGQEITKAQETLEQTENMMKKGLGNLTKSQPAIMTLPDK